MPAMQQVFAAMLLWLRTRWVYVREAAHLKEVAENLVEATSEPPSPVASYDALRSAFPAHLAVVHPLQAEEAH